MQNLKDKVVYITGGSKGIGFGVAETLLAAGMKVAFSSRKLEDAEAAAEKLGASIDKLLPLQSDVSNLENEQKAIAKVIEHFGGLDVLVANAGVGHFASIEDTTVDQWKQMIDTNLTGVFYSVKASVEALIKSKGYIITISSLAGANFFENGAGYNASKFGLVGFSQAIMLDLRQKDVKVSTIMPGSVATHFNNHTPNAEDGWKIQPEDIGELVEDLLRMNPRTLPSKIEVRPAKTKK